VKEYLSRQSVPFHELDVARDPRAAAEMVRITGQRGVPVTVIDGQSVVGHDPARLGQLLAWAQRPRLGVAVADAAEMAAKGRCTSTQGAYVGKVTSGEAAAQAGLQPGDVIILLAGQAIGDAAALERVVAGLHAGQGAPLVYLRGAERREAMIRIGI
jgi:glutaredoxin